jgi:uncharacterized RDD family membrane protein YckC
MKCPKCHYLGFETGDRCRNCGYDFSLLVHEDPAAPASELMLRPEPPDADQSRDAWTEPGIDLRLRPAVETPAEQRLDRADSMPVDTVPASRAAPPRGDGGLPLFAKAASEDPLVAPPPRRPVPVRRTPETPIARSLRSSREVDPGEPAAPERRMAPAVYVPPRPPSPRPTAQPESCEPRPRAVAALIDMAILSAIGLVVVSLTLRMAMLPASDWQLLPLAPLLLFLALVGVGYFAAFSAIGGQTIGKMVTGIRVVTDAGDWLTPGQAIQRSLAGVLSVVTLGAAFAPALVGSGLALHDRVSRTRVVARPPA